MRQQDKILSRQQTRLNPIKFHSSSWRGGKQNYRIFMIALQTGPTRYAKEVATLYEQML